MTTAQQNQFIAQTIFTQLGGNRFKMMTGAKDIFFDGPALQFKLPSNFANLGINFVKISLNSMDTYDITFKKIRGTKVTDVDDVTGIYCDQLAAIFQDKTGLDTNMGRVLAASV